MRPLITAVLLLFASAASPIEVPLATPLVGPVTQEIAAACSASNGHGYLVVGSRSGGGITIAGMFVDEQGQPIGQMFPILVDVVGFPIGLASDGDGYLLTYFDQAHSGTVYVRLDERGNVTRRGVLPMLTTSIAWCGVAYIAAYDEPGNDPGGSVAVIDADGTFLRSMPVIRRSEEMRNFHVAAGLRGNALVSWVGNDEAVYVMPVAAASLRDGTFVAPLITETPSAAARPNHTAIASGTADSLVVWGVPLSNFKGEIRGHRLDANGNPVGTPFVIARTDGFENFSIAVAGSRYVVAYSDRSGARMVTVTDGDAVTSPVVLSAQSNPSLTVAGGGARALIAWENASVLVGMLVDSAGAPLGSQPTLLSRSSYEQRGPRIAWCGDRYLATWGENGSDFPVMFARIRANGIPVDAVGHFIDASSKFQHAASVACNESSALIVWIDLRATRMIQGAIVDPDGTTHPAVTIAVVPDFAAPVVAWNGSHYVVAWSDLQTRRVNLARLSRDGQLVDVVPHTLPIVPGSVADDPPAIACRESECVVAWTADLFSVLHPHHHALYAVRLDAALAPVGSIRELAAPVNDEGDAQYPLVIAGRDEWGIAWSWHQTAPPYSTTHFSRLSPELETRIAYDPLSACTNIPFDGTAIAGGYRLICGTDLTIDSHGVVPSGTSDVVAISHGGGPLAITAHLSYELRNRLYIVAGDARSRSTRR